MELQPETLLRGRYKIVAKAGQGAMAVVYSADDQETGKRVAVKQMGMYVDNPEEKQLAIQQFEHEAQLLHSLEHPNIPRVYEWFEDGDERYLIMDFIEGEILGRHVDIRNSQDASPRALPPATQVVDWAMQITRALIYLHGQKPRPIIYKDLKPDNLMLGSDGQIKMLDFGIAKGRDAQGQYKTILKGMVSPGFAAPEQYAGTATDPRADLYALGATMYALLCGRVPPQAVDRHERVYNRTADPLVPVRTYNPDVSPQLEALIVRLMALKRDQRLPSAEHVLRELEALPEYFAVQQSAALAARAAARRRNTVKTLLLVLVIAILVGAAGLLWYRSRPATPPTPPKPKPKTHRSDVQPSRLRAASASVRSARDRMDGAWRSAHPA